MTFIFRNLFINDENKIQELREYGRDMDVAKPGDEELAEPSSLPGKWANLGGTNSLPAAAGT